FLRENVPSSMICFAYIYYNICGLEKQLENCGCLHKFLGAPPAGKFSRFPLRAFPENDKITAYPEEGG
ncbi:MAG: hypothetical protein ACI4Q3_03935, partial [Kiritimatiellia bacterium]